MGDMRQETTDDMTEIKANIQHENSWELNDWIEQRYKTH